MLLYLTGLAILAVGYFTYGRFLEMIVNPTDATTCAFTQRDGVDYVPMPRWKNMVIQLLNIAGTGPVVGGIFGIQYGKISFIIIPVGCVLGGAAYDYLAGMMSLRYHGANLPRSISLNLGGFWSKAFSIIVIPTLLVIVTVFVNMPAKLCEQVVQPVAQQAVNPGFSGIFWVAAVCIFAFYIAAMLFPVDKFIGKIYPLFGVLTIIGTLAIFVVLLIHGFRNPAVFEMSEGFRANMCTPEHYPFIPVFFMLVTCGLLSGFHAVSSPVVARSMQSERDGRCTFYGMMILEGFIAMVWAGAAMVIFNHRPELMDDNANVIMANIINFFLGKRFALLPILAIIMLAVTTGGAALRICRMVVAETLHVRRDETRKLNVIVFVLIAVISCALWWSNLEDTSFNRFWSYLVLGNQAIAVFALLAVTVWLMRQGKPWIVAFVPGTFMCFVIFTFVCWTSTVHHMPAGPGLPLGVSMAIAGVVAAAAAAGTIVRGIRMRERDRRKKTK
ncbi:MAG: hypothetical protein MJ025_06195 [Victivallaceae bacterium]|nr:hypothetical protein [Victivallaceae bacterium]